MRRHKVLCLVFSPASILPKVRPARPCHFFLPHKCGLYTAGRTRKWERVCWLARGREIRFSLTAPSDWGTQQTIRFYLVCRKQASGGVKGCYLSDEVRSKITWSNTLSQTVALFDRPLPFAAGDKSQFHHLPGGQSMPTRGGKKSQRSARAQNKHKNNH